MQHSPPLPLLFTSSEAPSDIDDLGEPFRQRWLLVVLLKPKIRDVRYLIPLSLCPTVSETEAIKWTCTIALTSFSRVEEARQYVLYMLLCQAKSMEFSNLKHLASTRKQNSMLGAKSIITLTGPGHQFFSQCQCNVSAFARLCSCCLDESTVSSETRGTVGDSSYQRHNSCPSKALLLSLLYTWVWFPGRPG